MRISMIVAMAKNRVIGIENRLPWSLPEDLKRFREITWGHTLIMGRKTFESIGRALPGRENSVISRSLDLQKTPGGIRIFSSLQQALDEAKTRDETEVFIIGGAQLYREAVSKIERIYLTRIESEFAGDAYMPEWDESKFEQIRSEESQQPFLHSYLIFDLRKRKSD